MQAAPVLFHYAFNITFHQLLFTVFFDIAVDLFSWGIFRKYEKKDLKWFEIFREKVAFEEQYL